MADQALAGLPPVFSYTEARGRGVSDRRLSTLRREGLVEMVGRGLYRRADRPIEADLDLLEIAYRVPDATLCLLTALARHDLTDAIPASIDVALPRGRWRPRTTAPVTWHSFATETFTVGREELDVTKGVRLGIYGPRRSLIDVFLLRYREGSEVAYEALRRWLRRPGSEPGQLLEMARSFPKAEPGLRSALEVLL